MKYPRLIDGEGAEFRSGERFKLACCDCGLVHQIVIVARGGKVGLAMKRDNRATGAMRRWNQRWKEVT